MVWLPPFQIDLYCLLALKRQISLGMWRFPRCKGLLPKPLFSPYHMGKVIIGMITFNAEGQTGS